MNGDQHTNPYNELIGYLYHSGYRVDIVVVT